MTQPLRIPDLSRLPWTVQQYPDILKPEFWRGEPFENFHTLRWSRYGCLFADPGGHAGAGQTVTYAFMPPGNDPDPSFLLSTLSKAGWKIMSFPDSTSNNTLFGELIFDPEFDLDEEYEDDEEPIDEAAVEAEAEAAMQAWYAEQQADFPHEYD